MTIWEVFNLVITMLIGICIGLTAALLVIPPDMVSLLVGFLLGLIVPVIGYQAVDLVRTSRRGGHDKDIEISRLKAHLAYYQRSRNYTPAVPEQSDPIMDDARKLIDLRFKNGNHPSRRYMNQFGWADDRHAAAMSLLASRGVVAIGQGNTIRWLDLSAPPAIAKLVADKSYLKAGALVTPEPPEGEG